HEVQVASRGVPGGSGVADDLPTRDALPRAGRVPRQVAVGGDLATVGDRDLVPVATTVVRPLHGAAGNRADRGPTVRPEVSTVVQLVHPGNRVCAHAVRGRD